MSRGDTGQTKSVHGQRRHLELVGRGHGDQRRPAELAASRAMIGSEGLSGLAARGGLDMVEEARELRGRGNHGKRAGLVPFIRGWFLLCLGKVLAPALAGGP